MFDDLILCQMLKLTHFFANFSHRHDQPSCKLISLNFFAVAQVGSIECVINDPSANIKPMQEEMCNFVRQREALTYNGIMAVQFN